MKDELFLCRVCHEMRPESIIEVKRVDRSEELGYPKGVWTDLLQFCSDKEECVKAAEEWNGYLLGPK